MPPLVTPTTPQPVGNTTKDDEPSRLRSLLAEARLSAKRYRGLYDAERKARIVAENKLNAALKAKTTPPDQPATPLPIDPNMRLITAERLASLEAQSEKLLHVQKESDLQRKKHVLSRVQLAIKKATHVKIEEQNVSMDELRRLHSDAAYECYNLKAKVDQLHRRLEDFEERDAKHTSLLVRVLQSRFSASRMSRAYSVLLKVLAVKLFVVERRAARELKALYATLAKVNIHFREDTRDVQRYGKITHMPPVHHHVDGTGGTAWLGDGTTDPRRTRRDSVQHVSEFFSAVSSHDADIILSRSSPRRLRTPLDGDALQAYMREFEDVERSKEEHGDAILRKRLEVERVCNSRALSSRDVLDMLQAEVVEMKLFTDVASDRLRHWHDTASAEQQGVVRLRSELVDVQTQLRQSGTREAALVARGQQQDKENKEMETKVATLTAEIRVLKKDNVRLSRVKLVREQDSARRLADRVRQLNVQRKTLETTCSMLSKRRERLAKDDIREERERALTALGMSKESRHGDYTFRPNVRSRASQVYGTPRVSPGAKTWSPRTVRPQTTPVKTKRRSVPVFQTEVDDEQDEAGTGTMVLPSVDSPTPAKERSPGIVTPPVTRGYAQPTSAFKSRMSHGRVRPSPRPATRSGGGGGPRRRLARPVAQSAGATATRMSRDEARRKRNQKQRKKQGSASPRGRGPRASPLSSIALSL